MNENFESKSSNYLTNSAVSSVGEAYTVLGGEIADQKISSNFERTEVVLRRTSVKLLIILGVWFVGGWVTVSISPLAIVNSNQ